MPPIDFTFIDALDILLVGVVIFQLYKLLKGTVAIKIFLGIVLIYLLWKLVSALQMVMLGEILGQFIGVGVIALLIVFQQELRQFLVFIGNREFLSKKPGFWHRFFRPNDPAEKHSYREVISACKAMAASRTGALIIVTKNTDPSPFIRSARAIDARLSSALIESIFAKTAPLHDGALLIRERRIVSAGGVLPTTTNDEGFGSMGMRHRAALGLSEQCDALVIVVSEERGSIAFAKDGILHGEVTTDELQKALLDD